MNVEWINQVFLERLIRRQKQELLCSQKRQVSTFWRDAQNLHGICGYTESNVLIAALYIIDKVRTEQKRTMSMLLQNFAMHF